MRTAEAAAGGDSATGGKTSALRRGERSGERQRGTRWALSKSLLHRRWRGALRRGERPGERQRGAAVTNSSGLAVDVEGIQRRFLAATSLDARGGDGTVEVGDRGNQGDEGWDVDAQDYT